MAVTSATNAAQRIAGTGLRNIHDYRCNPMLKLIGNRRLTATTAVFLLALAGPALASGDHEGGHEESGTESGGHGHEAEGHGHDGGHTADFGKPAPPSQADRTVEITARDTMKFAPGSITVKKGKTVTFVVDNVGKLQHSFTLGTPSSQQEHEKEMRGMAMDKMASHMEDDPTGMVVQPGETKKLTWHFTEKTPVQFACHIPGHYPAGMKGRIRVQ